MERRRSARFLSGHIFETNDFRARPAHQAARIAPRLYVFDSGEVQAAQKRHAGIRTPEMLEDAFGHLPLAVTGKLVLRIDFRLVMHRIAIAELIIGKPAAHNAVMNALLENLISLLEFQ